MKESTRDWLLAANDDLASIEILLKDVNLTNIIAFHAQQAIEKILKAVIEEFELGFLKTHNLQTLLSKVSNKIKLNYNELLIIEIDQLYIDARYPGDFGLFPNGKPSISDAMSYYQQAKELKEQIENKLT